MKESLGNLCQFLNGGTPAKSEARFFDGEIPWITSADITGPVAKHARSFITEQAVSASATNKVSAGTVLLVTRTGVGKVAIAGMDLCFSQDITALIPDSSRVDTHYLVHFLRTRQDYFLRMARGATIKGITRDVVANFDLTLPSIAEQRRIAAILDKADALRTKRREALAQLDRLAQSIFVEMFGDPVLNPKGWPTHPLRELASRIQIGPFGSQLHEEDYVEGGVPLINPTHIQQGRIQADWTLTVPLGKHAQLGQYHLSKGDLILGRRGEMGRCAVVSEDEEGWLCGTGSLFVRPKPSVLSVQYLQAVISSPPMRRHLENVSQGVTMPNLNKDIVGDLPIALPPKEHQELYFSRITSVSQMVDQHRIAAELQQQLFASLQHRAFQGEL